MIRAPFTHKNSLAVVSKFSVRCARISMKLGCYFQLNQIDLDSESPWRWPPPLYRIVTFTQFTLSACLDKHFPPWIYFSSTLKRTGILIKSVKSRNCVNSMSFKSRWPSILVQRQIMKLYSMCSLLRKEMRFCLSVKALIYVHLLG